MSEKNEAGGIKLLNFKIYHKLIAIKTVWYFIKQTYRLM
jgi:hypothetical protein